MCCTAGTVLQQNGTFTFLSIGSKAAGKLLTEKAVCADIVQGSPLTNTASTTRLHLNDIWAGTELTELSSNKETQERTGCFSC